MRFLKKLARFLPLITEIYYFLNERTGSTGYYIREVTGAGYSPIRHGEHKVHVSRNESEVP